MIKLKILFFFFIFIGTPQYTNAQEIKIKLKPNGHYAYIQEVLVTPDQQSIVSASDDKSIIIRDIATGEAKEVLLGNTGIGNSGSVYTIAISPDQKWLVAGGWMTASQTDSKAVGALRLYDFKTRKIVKLLHQHLNIVNFVTFSKDGKLLLSASYDNTITIWETTHFTPIQILKGHQKSVREAIFCQNQVISVSEDSTIKAWNIKSGQCTKTIHHGSLVSNIAVSPNEKHVAIGDQSMFVHMYDPKLNFIQRLKLSSSPGDICFSPNNQKLLAGSKSHDLICRLFELQDNQHWVEKHQLSHFDYITGSCVFIDNETMAIAGGFDNSIVIWSPTEENPEHIKKIISSDGKSFMSAEKNYDFIAYSQSGAKNNGQNEYEYIFHMPSGEFYIYKEGYGHFHYPMLDLEGYSIKHEKPFNSHFDHLNIIREKDTIGIVNEYNGRKHFYSYTFDNQYKIYGGGFSGLLEQYDTLGYKRADYSGHEGQIWGVTIEKENPYMVSASGDETIKIWNIAKADTIIFTPKNELHPTWVPFALKRYPYLDSSDHDFVAQLYDELALDSIPERDRIIESKIHYPIASLFISKDQEWVIWTEDGYYKSSPYGSQYIGYQINYGDSLSSEFYPFQQFDLKYNRPDIIHERLDLGFAKDNALLQLAYKKKLAHYGLTERDLLSEIHAPTIDVSSIYDSNKEKTTLHIIAEDTKYPLHKIDIWVNGIPIMGKDGVSLPKSSVQRYTTDIEVSLGNGKNEIQVFAINNKGGQSLIQTINVPHQATHQPELYIIGIGVGKYRDSTMNLEFADKDAEDIVKLFSSQKAYFGDIHTKLLLNEEVSVTSVKALREWLLQTKPDDQVILFYGSHGYLNKSYEYYLTTHTTSTTNPGIKFEDVEAILDGIPSRNKMMLIDACHSGSIDKQALLKKSKKKKAPTDITFRTIYQLEAKDTSAHQVFDLMESAYNNLQVSTGTSIISASGGLEPALESKKWNNGVFTFAIKYALENNIPDYNEDGKITVSELSTALEYAVKVLTKGRQNPNFRSKIIENDFTIWRF